MGRPVVQRLRHRTRARRVELGVGGVGGRQPRHLLDLRGDRRVVPAAGVAQRSRRPRDDQGARALWRCDRRRALPRPRGHQLPHCRGRGPGPRRAPQPRPRLPRPARHLRRAAARADPRGVLRELRRRRGDRRRQAARRGAHRRRARVHGPTHRQRRRDERSRQRRDPARSARRAGRGDRRVVRPRVSRRPVDPEHGVRLPPGDSRDPARPHARATSRPGTRAASTGSRCPATT